MEFPTELMKRFPFESYLVGGAVRDMVLGRDYNDIDIVVLGETPSSMLALGGREVSKSFPIYLFDGVDVQFALARRDRTSGYNMTDYVSLEEDLYRRDLTINSMALSEFGKLIDPYGGCDDLKAGVLRHVSSEHFAEDPHRIFRLARFAAQLNYRVADETTELVKRLVSENLVETVDSERISTETIKALLAPYPHRYFEVLEETGALARWLPEISSMRGIPQRPDFHAEGCVWVHNQQVMQEAAELSKDLPDDSKLRIRMAALLHDIGKTKTPDKYLWDADGGIIGKHPGHESPVILDKMFAQMRPRLSGIPSDVLRFAKLVGVIHQKVHRINEMGSKSLIRLYTECGERNFLGRERIIEDLAMACRADHQGRLILNREDGSLVRPGNYPEGDRFKELMTVILDAKEGPIMLREREKGRDILKQKEAVHRERMRVLAPYKLDEGVRSTIALQGPGI
jgi:tRNA nucleotidyltransferase (CCA-adding enzyme)